MARVALLRDLLAGTGWAERAAGFAAVLRRTTTRADGLLLVGPPDDEPWHLAAHLDDEASFGGATDLKPTLVRLSPPRDAPRHLAVGTERLLEVRRGEPLLVVSSRTAPETLLERVDDVRRRGGTVFSLDRGDAELATLAHEQLPVPIESPLPLDFDVAQHVLSLQAGEPPTDLDNARGWRRRLASLLDRISDY